jgi:transcriptional regulator with XRE-family HTH domain
MNTAKMTEEILSAGWTQAKIAAFCGVSQSTVGRWKKGLDPEGPNRDRLAQLYAQEISNKKPYSTFDPDAPEREYAHDEPDQGAGIVDGRVTFKGSIPGSAPETAARGGLGAGQIDATAARVQSNGIATGHPVAAEWVIPPAFTRHGLGGRPDTIIVVPVIGHSMEPRLVEGDRVIVDVSQNAWVGDAIYAIDDGDVNLQIKTIKKVTSSFPAIYRIISESSPDDEARLQADQFRIVGRVVGRISRP